MLLSLVKPLAAFGCRSVLLAILILASVSFSRAAAQGTGGVVPGPMGLRDVTELVSRYETLDPGQRLVFEEAHDRYLASYESLRDDEIESFLELGEQVEAASSGEMPTPELLGTFLAAWKDVVDRVEILDDRLFDELRLKFEEAQGDGIERARRVRDRQRLNVSAAMVGGNEFADIDACFWASDPTDSEVAAVDAVLRGYESSMPRLIEAGAEASTGMMKRLVEEMVLNGFGEITEEDMMDPERASVIMKSVEDAMAIANGPLIDAKVKIDERRIRMSRQIRNLLASDRWWKIKRRWMSSLAVQDFWGGENDPARVPAFADEVGRVLGTDGGTPASIASIPSIMDGWYQRDDRFTDELVEATLSSQLTQLGSNMPEIDGNSVREIKTRRAEEAARTIQALLALLSDDASRAEVRTAIDRGTRSIMQGGFEIPIPATTETAEDMAWKEDVRGARSVSNIPDPVSPSDLDLFAELLGLDDLEREIVATLHQDYLEAWGNEVDPELAGGGRGSTLEDFWGRLSNGLDAVLTVDDRFLSSIDVAVGSDERAPAMQAVRVQRGFDRITSISNRRFDAVFGLPVIEAVGPYRLFMEVDLPPADRTEILGELMAQAGTLKPAIAGWERRRFDSDRERSVRLAAIKQEIRGRVGADPDAQLAASIVAEVEVMKMNLVAFERRRAEADRLRTRVGGLVKDTVLPKLPPLAALELRLAMLDAGWSGVRKSGSTLEVARRIFRMKDLSEDQAKILESMFLGHLETEVAMVETMADRITSKVASSDTAGDFELEQAIAREIDKYNFRRNEFRERLLQRLLVILTAEQIERVPSLGERR